MSIYESKGLKTNSFYTGYLIPLRLWSLSLCNLRLDMVYPFFFFNFIVCSSDPLKAVDFLKNYNNYVRDIWDFIL